MSSDARQSVLPSGLYVHDVIQSLCMPSSIWIRLPVSVSTMDAVLSSDVRQSVLPSGLYAHDVMPPRCMPSSV